MRHVSRKTIWRLGIAAGLALGVTVPLVLAARSGGSPAASPGSLVAATQSSGAPKAALTKGRPSKRKPASNPQTSAPAGRGPIRNGVKLPPSDEAPPCNCTAPTPGLNTLVNAIRVHTRSVTSIVLVPANLAVPNRTEISVLFNNSDRITQDYNPAQGNRITFDYPVGDGKARSTRIDISLAEHAPDQIRTAAYLPAVTILPLFNVEVSPLTFELANQCDGLTFGVFGGENDSEPRIVWNDDQGGQEAYYNNAQSFHPIVIQKFARSYVNVSVNDDVRLSGIYFQEEDPPIPDSIPAGFSSRAYVAPGGPMLPGQSRKVGFSQHSSGQFPDEACNANFSYTIAIDLLTYNLL